MSHVHLDGAECGVDHACVALEVQSHPHNSDPVSVRVVATDSRSSNGRRLSSSANCNVEEGKKTGLMAEFCVCSSCHVLGWPSC